MVDVHRDLGVQVAQRVVAERGQVQHGVDAREILGHHLADVLVDPRHGRDRRRTSP
jgi:hypothetical protein